VRGFLWPLRELCQRQAGEWSAGQPGGTNIYWQAITSSSHSSSYGLHRTVLANCPPTAYGPSLNIYQSIGKTLSSQVKIRQDGTVIVATASTVAICELCYPFSIVSLAPWVPILKTRSHLEMVGDMSRVTLNFDLSKIPFVRF